MEEMRLLVEMLRTDCPLTVWDVATLGLVAVALGLLLVAGALTWWRTGCVRREEEAAEPVINCRAVRGVGGAAQVCPGVVVLCFSIIEFIESC